jgi:putative nucleotidyltransferase with HDIG domain
MRDNKMVLSIDSCVPGMLTAEAVFNKYGGVVLWENTILDENSIMHLKNMGITYISVYEKSLEDVNAQPADWAIAHDTQSFIIKYEQDVYNIKKALNDISSGKRLNNEVTDQIVEELVQRSEDNRNIINSIMQVRSIDEYTYYHSLNVSMLSMLIARWMKMDEGFVRICTEAGLLHDVGKTKVPIEIINKPGKLTDEEFAEMKRHPEYSYLIVNDNKNIDPMIAVAVLTHHEKEDGSGYPFGLTGDKIGLCAKIIAVSDIFDAMTANRVYKYKDTPFKVFELMQHGSFGVLNPQVLAAFLENITHYYIGAKVRLNTGEIGEVVFMNRLDFSKPVIKVDENFIDLAVSKTLSIVDFL